jgi:hypothetical protein
MTFGSHLVRYLRFAVTASSPEIATDEKNFFAFASTSSFLLFFYNKIKIHSQADIRNPLSLLAHERSRFAPRSNYMIPFGIPSVFFLCLL